MPRTVISALLFIAFAVPHAELLAQTIQPVQVRVAIPVGWTEQPSASPQFKVLMSPEQRIKVTIYATKSDAIVEETLEQRAKLLNQTILDAQGRAAKASGATLVEQNSSTTRIGRTWYAETEANWSNGLRVRGTTILQRGQQTSVGSESRTASQAELAKAVKQILASVQQ